MVSNPGNRFLAIILLVHLNDILEISTESVWILLYNLGNS